MKLRSIYRRLGLLGMISGAVVLQTSGCGFDAELFVNTSASILLSKIATDFVTTTLADLLNVSQGFSL